MANHANLTSLFSNIANAIRAKTGSSDAIVADDFPTAIGNIPTGSPKAVGSIMLDSQTGSITLDFTPTYGIIVVQNAEMNSIIFESWLLPGAGFSNFTRMRDGTIVEKSAFAINGNTVTFDRSYIDARGNFSFSNPYTYYMF